MYASEKGLKPPDSAIEAELCAPVLGLDIDLHEVKHSCHQPEVVKRRGDKRSLIEESLFLKAILASLLDRATSIAVMNQIYFLPLAMINMVTSRKKKTHFFFFAGHEIACIGAST